MSWLDINDFHDMLYVLGMIKEQQRDNEYYDWINMVQEHLIDINRVNDDLA